MEIFFGTSLIFYHMYEIIMTGRATNFLEPVARPEFLLKVQ